MPYNQEDALLREEGRMLKGQAKKDYQRRYMREYRLRKQVVRPLEMDGVRPTQPEPLFHRDAIGLIQWNPSAEPSKEMMAGLEGYDADGNPVYED